MRYVYCDNILLILKTNNIDTIIYILVQMRSATLRELRYFSLGFLFNSSKSANAFLSAKKHYIHQI